MTSRRSPKRDRARAWLLLTLQAGPLTVEAIRYQSHKAGLSWITVRRAKRGVVSIQRRGGLAARGWWVWELAKVIPPNGKALTGRGFCPVCGRSGGDPGDE